MREQIVGAVRSALGIENPRDWSNDRVRKEALPMAREIAGHINSDPKLKTSTTEARLSAFLEKFFADRGKMLSTSKSIIAGRLAHNKELIGNEETGALIIRFQQAAGLFRVSFDDNGLLQVTEIPEDHSPTPNMRQMDYAGQLMKTIAEGGLGAADARAALMRLSKETGVPYNYTPEPRPGNTGKIGE